MSAPTNCFRTPGVPGQHESARQLALGTFDASNLSICATGGDMKNKQLFAIVLTIILVTAVVIVTRRIHATPNPHGQNQSQSATAKEDNVPDHIFYGEIFSIIAKLKNVRDYQERA